MIQRRRPWTLDALAITPAFAAGLSWPYAVLATLLLVPSPLVPIALMWASTWLLSRRHSLGKALAAMFAVTVVGVTTFFLLLFATQTPFIATS